MIDLGSIQLGQVGPGAAAILRWRRARARRATWGNALDIRGQSFLEANVHDPPVHEVVLVEKTLPTA
jgi:hypothetical protein